MTDDTDGNLPEPSPHTGDGSAWGRNPGAIGKAAVDGLKNMRPAEMLQRGLDAALLINGKAVTSHLNRMRRSKPNGAPSDTLSSLKKQYLATITSTGLAVGGAAALPSVGTATALAFSGGEVVAFLEASTLYALSVAELHGVPVQDLRAPPDPGHRRAARRCGTKLVEQAAGRTGPYWGKNLVTKIPMSQINRMNNVLGQRFITKWGTKQGIIVLGRAIPFGIGAAIGAEVTPPSG